MRTAYVDPPPILVLPFDARRLIPRDGISYEDWRRRRHLDLSDIDEIDLVAEASAIPRRVSAVRDAGDRAWLRERWLKVRYELAARQRRPSTAPPPGHNGIYKDPALVPVPPAGLVVAGIALPQRASRHRDR